MNNASNFQTRLEFLRRAESLKTPCSSTRKGPTPQILTIASFSIMADNIPMFLHWWHRFVLSPMTKPGKEQKIRVSAEQCLPQFQSSEEPVKTMEREEQPVLRTERLLMRAFVLEDAPRVSQPAGDERIAGVTRQIPHPYPESLAEDWIAGHGPMWHAETGYWPGVNYWGHGYATEACRALVEFGFNPLELNKIIAKYLKRNPASGSVLGKNGFVQTGERIETCGYRKENEKYILCEITHPVGT